MKTIHWGVVGPGTVAASFAKALNELAKNENFCIKLTAVASRDKERCATFAKAWNFEKQYSDASAQKAGFNSGYEQLFADSEIDIVYIATPHRFHAMLSMQALRNGKHVLCEKPATVNTKELEQVIECAKKEHKFYMEALWTKFNPAIQQCLKWIENGKIGDILQVKADFCFAAPIYGENALGKIPKQYDFSNRLLNANLAGGAFLDVGIYPVTLAMLVAGCAQNVKKYKSKKSTTTAVAIESKEPCLLPKTIQAIARIGKTGVDLWNGINLRFGSEMIAQLSSAIDIGGDNGFQDAYILGTKGKIKIPFFWMAQSAELYVTEYNTDFLVEKIESPFATNGYEYEAIHVMECLENNLVESPYHTYTDMMHVCHVLDECRHQTGLIFPFEELSKKCNKEESTTLMAEKTGDEAMAQNSTGGKIVMYTDGACSGNPGPGGWGCVLIASGREIPLSGGEKLTTNNRMELMAAIQGLARLLSVAEWRVRPITVFIDSQYVKNGITKWIKGWKTNGWKTASKKPVKNKDLWMELDALTGKLDVEWNWVKGHAGNKYNEICDQLAVKAGDEAAQE